MLEIVKRKQLLHLSKQLLFEIHNKFGQYFKYYL